jgi:ubiquinone/menaquinone biosynthesis C-methylase UbiE
MNLAELPSPTASDPRIAFFNQLAPNWDQCGPDQATTLRRLCDLDGILGLRPGQEVLEVGCGTGQITGWLADAVRPGRVVAVDFASGMLERARARGVDAEFRLMDICDEQTVAQRFDLVLCFHSFPHFRDREAALRQMARYLKPGGQLVVLHLAGSAQLNAFHGTLDGPVSDDFLPEVSRWPEMLGPLGLRVTESLEREDLFLVKAGRVW